jgi:hypothetical protein
MDARRLPADVATRLRKHAPASFDTNALSRDCSSGAAPVKLPPRDDAAVEHHQAPQVPARGRVSLTTSRVAS